MTIANHLSNLIIDHVGWDLHITKRSSTEEERSRLVAEFLRDGGVLASRDGQLCFVPRGELDFACPAFGPDDSVTLLVRQPSAKADGAAAVCEGCAREASE